MKLKKWLSALVLAVACLCVGISVVQAKPDPAYLQRESIAIAKELRCPVSTNQSLYESEQPIAAEMKMHIYQMLEKGKTKEEIIQFFADRYGQQIRYEPQMSVTTSMLWGLPIVLIVAIGVWLISVIRRQRRKEK